MGAAGGCGSQLGDQDQNPNRCTLDSRFHLRGHRRDREQLLQQRAQPGAPRRGMPGEPGLSRWQSPTRCCSPPPLPSTLPKQSSSLRMRQRKQPGRVSRGKRRSLVSPGRHFHAQKAVSDSPAAPGARGMLSSSDGADGRGAGPRRCLLQTARADEKQRKTLSWCLLSLSLLERRAGLRMPPGPALLAAAVVRSRDRRWVSWVGPALSCQHQPAAWDKLCGDLALSRSISPVLARVALSTQNNHPELKLPPPRSWAEPVGTE